MAYLSGSGGGRGYGAGGGGGRRWTIYHDYDLDIKKIQATMRINLSRLMKWNGEFLDQMLDFFEKEIRIDRLCDTNCVWFYQPRTYCHGWLSLGFSDWKKNDKILNVQ